MPKNLKRKQRVARDCGEKSIRHATTSYV